MISETPRIASIVVEQPEPAVAGLVVLARAPQPWFPFVGAWDESASALDLWRASDGQYMGSAQLFDNGKANIAPVL